MPITLVTGLPGHGKTLYTLSRWKDEAAKTGRPVWHNNIKGLKIPGWQPIEVKDWANAPAGSLIVIDEAQFAFPVTGRGQTPEWVQKLATHRHLGLDFVVITQDPMLLDTFVRKLVDRHFHVVRKFGTHFATVYEFANGARENVRTNRNDGIRHEWRYPKDVFNLYESAELHTVKRRIPMRVWLLMIVPIVFGGLCWVIYDRMRPDNNVAAQAARRAGQSDGVAPTTTGAAPAKERSGPLGPLEYAQAYTPRVQGLPHTGALSGRLRVHARQKAVQVLHAARNQPGHRQGPMRADSGRGVLCGMESTDSERLPVAREDDTRNQREPAGPWNQWDTNTMNEGHMHFAPASRPRPAAGSSCPSALGSS